MKNQIDAVNFAYWLQGFAELSPDQVPTEAQWKLIKEHLNLVFVKMTTEIEPVINSDKSSLLSIDWEKYKNNTGIPTLIC